MTTTNPLLDEIHRIRAEISAQFGGDLRAMMAAARERQQGRRDNNRMHQSGEVERSELESLSSPPGDA